MTIKKKEKNEKNFGIGSHTNTSTNNYDVCIRWSAFMYEFC